MEKTLLRLVDYYLTIIINNLFYFCKSLMRIPTSLKSALQKGPLVILYRIHGHAGMEFLSGANPYKALQFI